MLLWSKENAKNSKRRGEAMYVMYPACFLKEENGYNVIFPDLPGAITCGDNFEDANRMAIDCLAGYIYTNSQLDYDIPKPSDVHSVDKKFAADVWEVKEDEIEVYPVSVNLTLYANQYFKPLVHKNVSIESWVDKEAKALGINFSRTLQEALIAKIQVMKKEIKSENLVQNN